MSALSVILNQCSIFFTTLYCSILLRKNRLSLDRPADETWLIEGMYGFPSFFATYYYIKASLRLGKRPKLIFLSSYIPFYRRRTKFKSKIMDLISHNRLWIWPWKILFLKIYGGRWVSFTDINNFEFYKNDAQKIVSNIKNKRELETLKICDVWVGDLIYDTYMRFKPAVTPDLNDPFLLELVQFSLAAIPFLKEIYLNNKITHSMTVYTTYLHHGLSSRVALHLGVSTHSIFACHQLVVRPTLDFPYHLRNYYKYREWFSTYQDKEKGLSRGKEIIDTRLSGQKDRTSFYVTESAFTQNATQEVLERFKILKNDSRKKVVFMCHDFIDSPHGTSSMLFPDFYEWLINALKHSKNSPYQFVIKPHPNSAGSEEETFSELKKLYPEVVFLPKKTSNLILRELDIKYLVTVYGTVAYEFAAMGYTVLCCGNNPHSAYSFSIEVKSEGELESILSGNTSPQATIDMNEIYEFLFIQHWRYDQGEIHSFPYNIGAMEMVNLIKNDGNKTEIMMNSIINIDSM